MVYTYALLAFEMIRHHTSVVICMIAHAHVQITHSREDLLCIAHSCGLWRHHANDKQVHYHITH